MALAFVRLAPDKADAILDGAAAEPDYAAVSSAIEAYRRGDPLGAAVALAYSDPYSSQTRSEGGDASAA